MKSMASVYPRSGGGRRGGGNNSGSSGGEAPPTTSSPAARTGGEGMSSARATGITIGLVLLSRILGVVRDIVFNRLFGQNAETSVYRAAFNVPDLIALVIAGGALSSVFIPVFADYWNREREDDAWRVFGTVVGVVSVVIAILITGMEIFVVPLTAAMHRDFHPDQIQETARLSAILLPGQWCLIVGGFLMGTLYARKRFLVPALGPVLYNLGTIMGGLSQWRAHPPDKAALIWGTLIGAFVGSILLPTFELVRIGINWRPGFDPQHEGVRKVAKLMLPVLLGLSLGQLTMLITQCSLPADERLSALTNAYNLTQAPIGIFAQAFGIVLLPTIAAYASQEDWPSFRKAIRQGIQRVLFLTIPASFLIAALALPIIRVLYVGNRYTDADAHLAAQALLCYSLGTFAWSAQAILFRGFVARQDMWTSVFITTPMVGVFYILVRIAIHLQPHGFTAIALVASITGTITMLLMLFMLQKRVGGLKIGNIAFSATRILIASAIGGAAAYFIARWFDATYEPDKATSLITLLVAGGVGIALYGGIAYVVGFPELKTIKEMFRRSNKPAPATASGDPPA